MIFFERKWASIRSPTLLEFSLLFTLESLVELVNASAGINKLLLAGKEGMALRANFNSDFAVTLRVGGTSGYGLAASALDGNCFILGMESLLHNKHLSFDFRRILPSALHLPINYITS